jgi:hypothetical protein
MSARLALRSLLALTVLALSACATAPAGPSVLVLPGSQSSFQAFQLDDDECRGFAAHRSGAQAGAAQAGAVGAVAATAIGAAAGAAIGAGVGDPATGAAIGAGTGLIWGTAYGLESATYAADGWQRSYDNSYLQCMYAKGHQVPAPPGVAMRTARWRDRPYYGARSRRAPPGEPIDDWSPPPPPRGAPPPPPPDLE